MFAIWDAVKRGKVGPCWDGLFARDAFEKQDGEGHRTSRQALYKDTLNETASRYAIISSNDEEVIPNLRYI